MNAEYIYNIFETTEKNGDPDLLIGMAKLMAVKPLPEGMDERTLGKFLAKHYHELVEAYAARDLAVMEEAVLACEEQDAEDAKEAE